VSQVTPFCLTFDGFTLRYATDLVLDSTVPSQIVYLWHNRWARQLVLCRIYFHNDEQMCRLNEYCFTVINKENCSLLIDLATLAIEQPAILKFMRMRVAEFCPQVNKPTRLLRPKLSGSKVGLISADYCICHGLKRGYAPHGRNHAKDHGILSKDHKASEKVTSETISVEARGANHAPLPRLTDLC